MRSWAQYRGWHGEADYDLVDTHDGTRFTVIRSKRGRITDHMVFTNVIDAYACIDLNREIDHDKALGR
jgi:hypothetical protein